MSTILKLTLGTGETQTVPFDADSIVTIRTRVQRDPGQSPVDEDRAFSNVAAFEIVDETGAPATVTPTQDPALASPQAAIDAAHNLAIADAAAHIEKALTLYPGDPDLVAVQGDLDDLVRSGSDAGWPPAQTADPAPAIAAGPVPPIDPAPADPAAAAADPATLETPEAAIEHAVTLDAAAAAAHIDAALTKFPGDPDLLEAQTELQAILTAANGGDAPAA